MYQIPLAHPLCLSLITFTHIGRYLEQLQCCRLAAHEEIAKVRCEVRNEITPIKPTTQHLIKEEHRLTDLVLDEEIREAEIIVVIQDIEVANHSLIGKVTLCVAHHLVKERESVTHTSISLLGNDM